MTSGALSALLPERSMAEFVSEFRTFASRIQLPKPHSERWTSMARQCCLRLEAKVDALGEHIVTIRGRMETGAEGSLSGLGEAIKEGFRQLQHCLETLKTMLTAYAHELAGAADISRLRELYDSLASTYEELVLKLRAMQLPGVATLGRGDHLKPLKIARNIFHIANAVTAYVMYRFFLDYTQSLIVLGILAGTFVGLDVARRYSPWLNSFMVDKLFKSIVRPFERHRTPSCTYFAVALLLVLLLYPEPAVYLSLLVLGFADPAASIVGKRYGRIRLYQGKSLEGCLAFFGTALLLSMAYLLIDGPALGFGHRVLIAGGVALVGTLVELFSARIDDNFSIPMAVGFTAMILL